MQRSSYRRRRDAALATAEAASNNHEDLDESARVGTGTSPCPSAAERRLLQVCLIRRSSKFRVQPVHSTAYLVQRVLGADRWRHSGKHPERASDFAEPFSQPYEYMQREWILTRSRIGPHQGVWEPTSLIFRMAYHTLLGKSAYVCLVVSVALHTTNICAVFVVMVRQYSNHGRWVACCTYSALVVALHPLSVEAICWASAQVRSSSQRTFMKVSQLILWRWGQGYPLAGLFSVCSVAAQLSHTSTSTSAMLPHCKRAVVCGSYACAVLVRSC